MKNRTITMVLVATLASLLLADTASAYYSPRMGRFLGRDPIREPGAVLLRTRQQATRFIPRDPIGTKHERNSYEFTTNNPVNRIDRLGLRSASGTPKPGLPHCKLNDQLIQLSFDGSSLIGGGFNASAVSGMPIKKDMDTVLVTHPAGELLLSKLTTVFDYSQQRQQLRNEGPIPEGGYWFDICSEGNESNRWDHWLKLRSWGDYSWALAAWPTTVTYGRSDFFIHGGLDYGSRGCIDIRRNDTLLHQFTEQVYKSNACCCYINVDVRYTQRFVTKVVYETAEEIAGME
jgi:hypothetical protein